MANQISSSNVRVVLRVRPFLPSELNPPSDQKTSQIPCVSILDQHSSGEVTVRLKDQFSSRNECYKLDSFFGQEGRVGNIFEQEVSVLIPGLFQGINATVFAYGATGSGKTYTMQGTESEPGLIPLAMSAIFSMCENTKYSVQISYYEVYLDRCYDLLEPKAKEVMALDDKDGKVQLKGLFWASVKSVADFSQIYTTGLQRRKVAHTGLNDVSSRSHAVLSVVVSDGSSKGKLNLIDLAGNEDNRRTQNEGIRMQESAKINESLFALSNVISALNNRRPYIPYRESKLTRILQDSLGGASRALMVACLNPMSYQEAIHTVSLAARSRQITNHVGSATKQETPKTKVDMEAKLRAWLESKGKTRSIQRLDGLLSPIRQAKTPSSVSSVKAQGPLRSSLKKKVDTADREGSRTKKKISFDLRTDEYSKDMGKIELETNLSEREEDRGLKGKTTNGNTFVSSNSSSQFFLYYFVDGTTPCGKENLQSDPSSPPKSPLLDNSPIRKALSPISANCDPDKSTTPLVKFNNQSSNLKESLVRDYLMFLNTASKEELMQIKGIGEKRAEYILEERENAPEPFKSLVDLERIGLSSKQVKDLFQQAAQGIFS
ncbi:Kinesin-like protein [Rhynchospora pubera]|uniref:Kinesin-like protein n=1 Tax=Rhynchospora pubera TaxID=906938 RepID=A0AAV8FWP0_9POAL|nr:Kinesin-like protein [Rhynchospora pubera]